MTRSGWPARCPSRLFQPSAGGGLSLSVSSSGDGEKTVCPFHLSSFLMTSESAWCLGANFLLAPTAPPCSQNVLWLVVCRDCRHKVHLNTYEKNSLTGQILFPRRANQTALLKSVGSCLHEEKLFTWVQTGVKSHFPLVLFEFLWPEDLALFLYSLILFQKKSSQNGEFVFSLTRNGNLHVCTDNCTDLRATTFNLSPHQSLRENQNRTNQTKALPSQTSLFNSL